MISRFSKLKRILWGLPKTVLFNFKHLDFKDAIKLPIVISGKTIILKDTCKIVLPPKIQTGMIRIGFNHVGVFDYNYSRTILEMDGTIEFNGRAKIGHGSRISIVNNGRLTFGDNVTITAEGTVICEKQIEIGRNCLISWQTMIMDTDFHFLKDINTSETKEKNRPIIIGNDCWIGMRSIILKGTILPDKSVVGASAVCNKNYTEEGSFCIFAGNPAKCKKKGYTVFLKDETNQNQRI